MNKNYPHEIITEAVDKELTRRAVPLTDEEAKELRAKTADERGAWLEARGIPTTGKDRTAVERLLSR